MQFWFMRHSFGMQAYRPTQLIMKRLISSALLSTIVLIGFGQQAKLKVGLFEDRFDKTATPTSW
jgi:hypothetical protein